ncbi:MAG: hypothetical protein AAF658_15170 [Myxococcota bacterium]
MKAKIMFGLAVVALLYFALRTSPMPDGFQFRETQYMSTDNPTTMLFDAVIYVPEGEELNNTESFFTLIDDPKPDTPLQEIVASLGGAKPVGDDAAYLFSRGFETYMVKAVNGHASYVVQYSARSDAGNEPDEETFDELRELPLEFPAPHFRIRDWF